MTVTRALFLALRSIEALGNRVYARGHVPPSPGLPYVVLTYPISSAVALVGDQRTIGRRRLAQVDLWDDPANPAADLPGTIETTLDGARLATNRWTGRIRVWEVEMIPDEEEHHHAITVAIPTD